MGQCLKLEDSDMHHSQKQHYLNQRIWICIEAQQGIFHLDVQVNQQVSVSSKITHQQKCFKKCFWGFLLWKFKNEIVSLGSQSESEEIVICHMSIPDTFWYLSF